MSQQNVSKVGDRLRALRRERGLSLRALSELCGLSPNTISLTERGTTSPSVSTLHRLASALGVPVTYFLTEHVEKTKVIVTRAGLRTRSGSASVVMESLGSGLDSQMWAPFIATLKSGATNGRRRMVHSGHELIYCLQGKLDYEIAGEQYSLAPGDALLFRAELPHGWRNPNRKPAVFLLVVTETDNRREPLEQHLHT